MLELWWDARSVLPVKWSSGWVWRSWAAEALLRTVHLQAGSTLRLWVVLRETSLWGTPQERVDPAPRLSQASSVHTA